MEKRKKVLLGMSGGVDSTVAALLLSRQGYEVVGATLLLHPLGSEAGERAQRDIEDAEKAAKRLGIRHMVLDWREQFRQNVVEEFACEYRRGATPNPCVTCNKTVKFPSLIEAAQSEGIPYVATGHYAIMERGENGCRLRRAKNTGKDQSYALYGIKREWLGGILFPLGEYGKDDVRAMAAEAGLEASGRGDSQDICFVPGGDYCGYLETLLGLPCPEGDFINEAGEVLGRHRGLWRYTIGQRRGLGTGFGKRLFVSGIDAHANTVTLAENERLFARELLAENVAWLEPPAGQRGEYLAKIRYNQQPEAAVVHTLPGGRVRAVFQNPQRAVTPGQAVVFYQGEYLAGGGTIACTAQPE